MASVCDHLRVIRKLIPGAAANPDFIICDRIWWFGFARCMQIKRPDDFYPFRADFVGDLIPEHKATFGECFTTTEVCGARGVH